MHLKNNKIIMQDIANALNISRTTVYRALRGKGRVKEETKKQVLKESKRLGYKANKAAIMLASSKKEIVIGALFPSEPKFFFEDVYTGIEDAAKELKDFGLYIKYCQTKTHDVDKQFDLFEKLLKEKVSGIVITPSSPVLLNDLINKATHKGIPVITFLSDAPISKRLCFIGQDLKASGKVAGELMGKFIMGTGKIAVLTGFSEVWSLQQRVEGFRYEIGNHFKSVDIIGQFEYFDDVEKAYKIAKHIMKTQKDLAGIYTTSSAGTVGVGRAVNELRQSGKITVIGFDLTDEIRDMLLMNTLQATICQDPYAQGYYSIKILFKYLVEGIKPSDSSLYTNIEIIIRGNVNKSLFNKELYR